MIMSQTTAYALRIVGELARLGVGTRLLTRELATRTGLPRDYTAKVVQSLRKIGVVDTLRGRGGGVCLGDCRDRSIWSLILECEGTRKATSCILADHGCDREAPCLLHGIWSEHRARLVRGLQAILIKDLASATVSKRLAGR